MNSVSDILDKVKELKDSDGPNDGMNRSRSAFACGVVGAIAGLMIGSAKGWNLFYSGLGGALAGSVVGTIATRKS